MSNGGCPIYCCRGMLGTRASNWRGKRSPNFDTMAHAAQGRLVPPMITGRTATGWWVNCGQFVLSPLLRIAMDSLTPPEGLRNSSNQAHHGQRLDTATETKRRTSRWVALSMMSVSVAGHPKVTKTGGAQAVPTFAGLWTSSGSRRSCSSGRRAPDSTTLGSRERESPPVRPFPSQPQLRARRSAPLALLCKKCSPAGPSALLKTPYPNSSFQTRPKNNPDKAEVSGRRLALSAIAGQLRCNTSAVTPYIRTHSPLNFELVPVRKRPIPGSLPPQEQESEAPKKIGFSISLERASACAFWPHSRHPPPPKRASCHNKHAHHPLCSQDVIRLCRTHSRFPHTRLFRFPTGNARVTPGARLPTQSLHMYVHQWRRAFRALSAALRTNRA